MSGDVLQYYDLASAELLNRPDVQVLSADQERALLLELDECKTRLLELRPLLAGEQSGASPEEDEEIQGVVRRLLDRSTVKTEMVRPLVPLAERYNEIRTKLAMANLRLVAHVARKYRNRGITGSDLLQEGFCGLLKAIDRFEPEKETRLASYAVWWIRQALQRAVAAGPIRCGSIRVTSSNWPSATTDLALPGSRGGSRARTVRRALSGRSSRPPGQRSR